MGAYRFKAGSRIEIYNLATGEKRSFHAIDAKTCLSRGGWSLDPPAVVSQEQAIEAVEPLTEPIKAEPSKDDLVAYAVELKIGSASALQRWSIAKLVAEIAKAKGD